MSYSILLVDDEENILKSLTRVLGSSRYAITSTHGPRDALELVKNNNFDLVISDQRMPKMLGTELLKEISSICSQTRRILMSAYADFADVTDAFNSDSIHQFISKPCDADVLREVVSSQLSIYDNKTKASQTELQSSHFSTLNHSELNIFHEIVSSDPVMLKQAAFIKKVANFGAPFFIHGETGTGKELFAKAIHNESQRKQQTFLAFNCANLTETLLESQLFGHVKGAFTGADKDQQGLFAAADKGTLFLDEVTEIPLGLQAKLLRVLQEKEFTPLGQTKPIKYDLQIISASSLSFKEAVSRGKFRDDLRYRLEIMPVNIPPLRERKNDLKPLFNYLLKQQFASSNIESFEVEDDVYHFITAYPWPGNVRELVNVCTYAAAIAQSNNGIVSITCLPDKILKAESLTQALEYETLNEQFVTPLKKEMNKEILQQILLEFSGNKTAAAKHLGVSRMTLWRKMKKFALC